MCGILGIPLCVASWVSHSVWHLGSPTVCVCVCVGLPLTLCSRGFPIAGAQWEPSLPCNLAGVRLRQNTACRAVFLLPRHKMVEGLFLGLSQINLATHGQPENRCYIYSVATVWSIVVARNKHGVGQPSRAIHTHTYMHTHRAFFI